MKERAYIAIDLKSFYASVECIERGLDPMTTNLVVADRSRTEKTICLAVSPSLKAYGIPGRPRLFEVVQRVKEVNAERRYRAPGHAFTGASCSAPELKASPALSLDYIIAPPRMAHYIAYSTKIYNIYLNYIAPEDIHVYSIDEVFIDATHYLSTYKLTARELAMKLILDVLRRTGVTATAGIGTILYLCKVAMDIVAKHIPADKNGVRIAELDEMGYRRLLWAHTPLTDFWRVGPGYAKKLKSVGLHTMGDIARCSVGRPDEYHNEELLYRLFGINAELLIDHAWGYEPCTIAQIKAYRPASSSIGSGQVLHEPYTFERAEIIVREMAEALSLDLLDKGLVADQLTLTVGYDRESLTGSEGRSRYKGEVSADRYGREVPKPAHGSAALKGAASSSKRMVDAALDIFERITDKALLIRRINIAANNVTTEAEAQKANAQQLSFFTSPSEEQSEQERLGRESAAQRAMLDIRKRFGKNAILKGTDLKEGATAMDRNRQIGGHKE